MNASAKVNEFCHYATYAELDFLRSAAAQLPAAAEVVMLGAGPGVMAMAVKEGNSSVWLTVIDHDTVEWVTKHLAAAGLGWGVTTITQDSVAALPMWLEDHHYHDRSEKVDLLIIDADHSYEGVSRDMRAWLPHLVPGGLVFFHDYSASGTEFEGQEQYPGVALAIGQFLPKNYSTVARVGTAIAFRNDWAPVIPPYH